MPTRLAPPAHPPTRTLAVVGGGFAGTMLAKALAGRLPAGWQLLLISEESYTTFNPMLPEVVGAGVFPEHVVAPIREMLPGVRFVMGTVRSVESSPRRLVCDTLAGPLEFAHDARDGRTSPPTAQFAVAQAHQLAANEWTWGLAFPLDITHLRITRTADIDRAARSASSSSSPTV